MTHATQGNAGPPRMSDQLNAGATSVGPPPVQFLAGLSRNFTRCPGSREKGAGTPLCPAYVEFKLQPHIRTVTFSCYIGFKLFSCLKWKTTYRIMFVSMRDTNKTN